MAWVLPLKQGEPGLTARLRELALGPHDEDAPNCAHNYIVHHVDGKTIYVCSHCGSTIQ